MAISDGCDGCIPLPWLHEHVTIDLPSSNANLASKKLHWAMQKVTKLTVEPGLRFKVGITANPPLRWEFYAEEVAQIESSIILKCGSIDVCVNIAPGGEASAMMRGPPFYNYVCFGNVDE